MNKYPPYGGDSQKWAAATHSSALTARTVQGCNIRHWSAQGLEFWAVSDLDGEELGEFASKIAAAARPNAAS